MGVIFRDSYIFKLYPVRAYDNLLKSPCTWGDAIPSSGFIVVDEEHRLCFSILRRSCDTPTISHPTGCHLQLFQEMMRGFKYEGWAAKSSAIHVKLPGCRPPTEVLACCSFLATTCYLVMEGVVWHIPQALSFH